MKNIIKIVLVMLSAVSFSAVQAGELNVTGTAKASYVINSSEGSTVGNDSAKGLGVANEFNLGATGELPGGQTWKYNINIDGATVQDDGGLSITDTTLGTVAVNISQGGLAFHAAGAVSVAGDRPSDQGFVEGMVGEHAIDDMNNVQYHTPAGLLPFGLSVKVGYAPDTTADADASVNNQGATNPGTFTAPTAITSAQGSNIGRTMSAYQVSAAPIEGLSIGASYHEFGNVQGATAQAPESGSVYAKYIAGPATIAYSRALVAQALAKPAVNGGNDFIEYFENDKYSLAVNVNSDLSLSYVMEKSMAHHQTAATANVELESSGIAAAYTVGGMTLAVQQSDHENVGYVANVDTQSTVFTLAVAF
jgi:hypothetical protein